MLVDFEQKPYLIGDFILSSASFVETSNDIEGTKSFDSDNANFAYEFEKTN